MDILGDQSSLGRLRGPTTRQKSSSFAAPERLCASTSCTPRFVDGIGGEFAVRASNFSDFGPPPASAPQPPKPPSTPLSPSPSNKLQEVRRILQQEPLAAQRRQSCPAHPDTHLLSSASARVSTDFAPEVTAPGHPVYVVRRAYRSSLDGSQPSSANSTAPGDEAPPGAWAHTNGAQSHSGWAATSSVGRAPSAGPSPLPSRRALHPRSGSCTPTVGASAPGSPLLPPPPPNAAGGLGQVPLAKVPGTASLPKPPPQEGVHLHSCSPGGESEASSPQHGGVGAGGGAGGSMGGAAMMATRPPRPSRFKSSNGLLVSSIAPPPALASSPLHSAASGPLLGGHGQGQGGHGRGSATCGGGFTTVSQSTSAAVSPPHTPRGRGSGNGDWPPPVTAGSGAQGSTAPSCHSHMGSPFGDARHDGDPESLPSPFSELPTSSQIFSSLLRAGSAGASGRGPTRLFAHDPDGLPISNTAPRGPMAISDTGAATGGLMGQASGALRSSKSGAGPVAVAAAAAAAARPQPPGLGLVSGHLLCRVLLFLYYSAVLVAEVDAWRNHSIRQSASARLRRLEEEEEEEGFWHYGARSGPQRGAGSSGLLSSIQGWIRTALAVLDPGGTGPLAAAFPLAHAALAVPCLLALLGGVWWEPAALVLGGRLLWDLACRHGWGLLMFYKGESAQLMRMKELAVVGATLVAAARSIPAAGGSSIVNTSNGTNTRSGSSSSGGTSRNGSTASLSAAAAAAAASSRAAASAAAAGDSCNASDYDSGCGSGTDGGNMTPRLSSPLARGAGHSSSSSAAWPQHRRPSAGEAHARDLRRGGWRQDSPTPGAGGFCGAAAAHAHSPPPALASSGHKLPPPPPSLPRSPSVRAPLPQLGSEAPLPEPQPLSDAGGEHASDYLDAEAEEEGEPPRGRRGPSSRHHYQHPSRGVRGAGPARGRLGGLAGALMSGRWALLQAGLGLMAPLFLYYGCVQVEHVRDMQDAGGVGGALRELVGDTYRWVPPGDGSLNTFWLPSQFAMALPYFTGMGPQWLAVALAGAVGMEGLLCWRFWARGGMLWTYAFYVGRHFLANAVIAGGVLLSLPAAQVQAPARSAALWRRKHKTT